MVWSDNIYGGHYDTVGFCVKSGPDSDNSLVNQFGIHIIADQHATTCLNKDWTGTHYINGGNMSKTFVIEGPSPVKILDPEFKMIQSFKTCAKLTCSGDDPNGLASIAVRELGCGRIIAHADRNWVTNGESGRGVNLTDSRGDHIYLLDRMMHWLSQRDGSDIPDTCTKCATDRYSSAPTPSPHEIPPHRRIRRRINCGGIEVNYQGLIWESDSKYLRSGGSRVRLPLAGDPPTPFNTERWIPSPNCLNYEVDLSEKEEYLVRLHFVENWANSENARLIRVRLENKEVLDNFDIFKEVRGRGRRIHRDFRVTVDDGSLSISICPILQNAKCDALEIFSPADSSGSSSSHLFQNQDQSSDNDFDANHP